MTNKLIIIIIFVLSLTVASSGQTKMDITSNLKWQKRYVEKKNGLIHIAIDTVTLDSVYIDKYEFKRINKEGVLIEYMKIESHNLCTDDGYDFSGDYQRFYDSGKLHKTGKLRCNLRTGEWFEFYDEGSIKKYTNYFRSEQTKNKSLKQGLYKEYFQNGKTKIRGQYQVFESFQTFEKIDYQTYEIIDTCCSWQLVSRKTSKWIEYNRSGLAINETNFEVLLNDKNLRDYPNNVKTVENK